MFTIQTHSLVRRPIQDVFTFVADQTNTPLWQTGLIEVRRVTPDPIGVGTEHIFVRTMLGRRYESRTHYVEFVPDQLVAFEVDDGTVAGRVTYRFNATVPSAVSSPDSSAPTTQVSCEMQFSLHGIARLAEPLLRRQIERESQRDDLRLAKVLEEREPAS